jgi:DNA-binding MarR family transcriptional regulator
MQPTKADPAVLEELALGLRDVLLGVRRSAPGDDHDRAAVGLLAHLLEVGPVRAGDLAERACLDPSTVSRHLRALEDAGHLVRTPDHEDRRATLLEVSPSGRALVLETRAQRIAILRRATAAWSDKDLATVTRLVRRLADDLET